MILLRRRRSLTPFPPDNELAAAVLAARRDHPIVAERADALLRIFLTDEQWETWKGKGYFAFKGSHGGRYCLHKDDLFSYGVSPYLLKRWPRGRHGKRLCCSVGFAESYRDVLPMADQALAIYLRVTTNEREFRLTAQARRGYSIADHPRRKRGS